MIDVKRLCWLLLPLLMGGCLFPPSCPPLDDLGQTERRAGCQGPALAVRAIIGQMDAQLRLGEIKEAEGDYDAAIAWYRRAARDRDTSSMIYIAPVNGGHGHFIHVPGQIIPGSPTARSRLHHLERLLAETENAPEAADEQPDQVEEAGSGGRI